MVCQYYISILHYYVRRNIINDYNSHISYPQPNSAILQPVTFSSHLGTPTNLVILLHMSSTSHLFNISPLLCIHHKYTIFSHFGDVLVNFWYQLWIFMTIFTCWIALGTGQFFYLTLYTPENVIYSILTPIESILFIPTRLYQYIAWLLWVLLSNFMKISMTKILFWSHLYAYLYAQYSPNNSSYGFNYQLSIAYLQFHCILQVPWLILYFGLLKQSTLAFFLTFSLVF